MRGIDVDDEARPRAATRAVPDFVMIRTGARPQAEAIADAKFLIDRADQRRHAPINSK